MQEFELFLNYHDIVLMLHITLCSFFFDSLYQAVIGAEAENVRTSSSQFSFCKEVTDCNCKDKDARLSLRDDNAVQSESEKLVALGW